MAKRKIAHILVPAEKAADLDKIEQLIQGACPLNEVRCTSVAWKGARWAGLERESIYQRAEVHAEPGIKASGICWCHGVQTDPMQPMATSLGPAKPSSLASVIGSILGVKPATRVVIA